MIVEDDVLHMKLFNDVLESRGYQTLRVTDADSAVPLARQHHPDLIVMDILLPKMNGLEATSLIRKNPKTQTVPILAATCLAMPGDREKCLQVGCNDYLPKPFTHKELGASIKKLLKKAQKNS